MLMFELIYGNDKNKNILKEIIKTGRYSHAYLFAGPKGTQKRDAAIEFAKSIFCLDKHKRPCGTCDQCIKVKNDNHPDLHEIKTGVEGESIKISQIRQLQKSAALKPYEGDRKIYIINSCETMGIPSQNAILKILEEPEEGIIIILVANSKSSIIPTILSRCQILNFVPLQYEEFCKVLKEKGMEEGAEMKFLYQVTQGRIGEALLSFEDSSKLDLYKSISAIMDKICTGNFDKIFKIPDIAKENNIKELELTDYLLIYLRHKLLDKITRDENNETDYLTVEKINDIIEAIMDLQTNTKINLNMPLQIENLLLRIQEE